jgi:serine/threonine-protein kinase RsbW
MAESHRMTRAAYLESLNDFRTFLKEHCSAYPGVTDEILYDLQLAVDEACTNIVTHGYAGMDPGSIILDLELDSSKVKLSLTDFGHSFEPDSTLVPNVDAPIEEREAGGFGLFFIQQSVDRMDYRVTEDGNTMTLIKHLAKPTEAEHEN